MTKPLVGERGMRKVCVDYRSGYGWCWCEGGRLVCVDLSEDVAVKELERGTPLCTRDFCREGG